MITAREIAAGIGSMLIAPLPERATRYRHAVVDSRRAGRGDLFVALEGERVDGHDFVAAAAERGATGAIVRHAVDARITQYVVTDPLVALQQLAKQRRAARRNVRVIGVTGSVGKTTTKELIGGVLAQKYRVLKNEGNLNSEIGLPLVLLELTERHERAVLEMGMWAPGEIALLCEIARPEIGVVTMVGPVHMERLGTMEAIENEKGTLPASLPENGVAVLNADDPRVAAMSARTAANVITFGFSPEADVRAEDVESHGLAGVRFTLVHGSEREPVYSHVPGRDLVRNALAAASVALVDGITLADIALALGEVAPQLRMCAQPGHNGSTIIDDTYNASPASMLAALELLSEMSGRKVAVLGDMRELGAAQDEGHHAVGRRAAEVADVIYAVGELGAMIGEAAHAAGHRDVRIVADKDEVAAQLVRELEADDVVLVKASRSLALETVVEALRADPSA